MGGGGGGLGKVYVGVAAGSTLDEGAMGLSSLGPVAGDVSVGTVELAWASISAFGLAEMEGRVRDKTTRVKGTAKVMRCIGDASKGRRVGIA